MSRTFATLMTLALAAAVLAVSTPASAHGEHWTCGGGVSLNGPVYVGVGNCLHCIDGTDSPGHYHCNDFDDEKCTGLWTGEEGADGGKYCVYGVVP